MNTIKLTNWQLFDALRNTRNNNDIIDLWQSYCDDKRLPKLEVYKMSSLNNIFCLYTHIEVMRMLGCIFSTHDAFFIYNKDNKLESFSDIHSSRCPINYHHLTDWILERYQEEFIKHYSHLISK